MSDIYKRIRSRREELGLSQEALAIRMGYKSKSSINKIEMGVNDIPQSKVIAFAKALDTTTAYLMGDDDSKERRSVPIDASERNLLDLYRKLNPEGQEILADYADTLVSSGKYIKTDASGLGQKKA